MKLLRFCLTTILILGIFFRFVNIEKKLYWYDETHTSMRIAGYTPQEIRSNLYTGSLISPLDIQKYQRLNSERSLIDTVNALAVYEPQHPPLYYAMARLWAQCFGDSVAAIRSLSAFISLLTFPCIYWLCLELFSSPLVGWLGMGLIAVSPFHVLYAQEARQYSLWTVTILLSSATLLQAIRVKTKLSWGIYAIALALGLYTFPLTIFVVTGHAIYVCINERFRLSKTSIAYLLASLGAIIAFIPWLWLIITRFERFEKTTGWVTNKKGVLFLFKEFFSRMSRLFVDFNRFDEEIKSIYLIAWLLMALIVLIVSVYSAYFLYQNKPKKWFFVVLLIAVTPLGLLIPDLVTGGIRVTVSRYVIPCYLAIHLSVAYLLASNIASSVDRKKQHIWRLLTIVLLSAGLLSCGVSSQAEFWNIKGSEDSRPLAAIVNQADNPLVISDASVGTVMELSYLLDPKVRLQLVVKSNNIPSIPANGFSDVFLYRGSKGLRQGLEQEQNYNVEVIPALKDKLWRVEK